MRKSKYCVTIKPFMSLAWKLKKVKRVSVIDHVCLVLSASETREKEALLFEGTLQYKAAVKI